MAVVEVPAVSAGTPVRRLNLHVLYAAGHGPADGAMVNLSRSTATGEVGGFTVYSQRRGTHGQPVLCIRVDAPDGRVLYIAKNLSTNATNSRGPTSTLFGGHVGLAFNGSRTPAQDEQALASLSAAFEKAWTIAATPPQGERARKGAHWDVQAAAALMPDDAAVEWRTHHAFSRALHDGNLDMSSIARAHACGWTPESSLAFYGAPKRLAGLTRPRLTSDLVFARAGWTESDVEDLAVEVPLAYRLRPMPTGWAQFAVSDALVAARAGLALRFLLAATKAGLSLDDALLAHAAGLSAGEVTRLVRSGRLDRDALASLAALRQPAVSVMAASS